MLAATAAHEGLIAADNALGRPRKRADQSVIPELIYTEPEIASVGLSPSKAEKEGREVLVKQIPFAGFGRAETLAEPEGFVQVVADPETHQVLGTQIVGARATDLIGEAALAIQKKLTLEDLSDLVHGHPTMYESVWEAASSALKKSIYYV